MSPLGQSILEKLPWLVNDLGFRIVQDFYSPEVFGDCDVVLNGPQVRLRFVRDRGQILVYLAPLEDPQRWWNLVFLLEVIHGVVPEPEFLLEGVAGRVQENLPALVQALGPQLAETRRELERREQLRLQALRGQSITPSYAKPNWLRRLTGA